MGFGLIRYACASARLLIPARSPRASTTPAQEAQTYANCSDEATWEDQTSVFNIDDRLACGEFSHPTKTSPVSAPNNWNRRLVMLGFPNRVPGRTEQWLLWRKRSGRQAQGWGAGEGDGEGDWAFQQLVQKGVEQMAVIKNVCMHVYLCTRMHELVNKQLQHWTRLPAKIRTDQRESPHFLILASPGQMCE